jgi:hypothetical protein
MESEFVAILAIIFLPSLLTCTTCWLIINWHMNKKHEKLLKEVKKILKTWGEDLK